VVAQVIFMQTLDTLLSRELQMSSNAKTAYRWSRTRFLNEFEQLITAVADWPGMMIHSNRDELQFVAGNSTVAQLRWNGRLDVLVPSELTDRLIVEAMAARDPHPSRNDRVVWTVRTHDDVQRAVWLLRLAYICSGEGQQMRTVSNDC